MQKEELSIIMPAYNVGKYLKPCIESLIRQSYADWRLIVIDDGSTDDTAEIVDRYAAKDARITPVHIKNSGPGHARNIGLQNASGAYISFMDSDDVYGTDTTLEENMNILKADRTIDFLQFPYLYQRQDGTTKWFGPFRSFVLNSQSEILSLMGESKVCGYLWQKIFKAEIFQGLTFPEDMLLTEDLWVIIDVAQRSNKFYMSNKGFYKYYQRENSLLTGKTKRKETEVLKTYLKLNEALNRNVEVSLSSKANWFVTTINHLVRVNACWGCDLDIWLSSFKKYLPSLKACFASTNGKAKLKIFLIHLMGLDRYVSLKTEGKKRKLARAACSSCN